MQILWLPYNRSVYARTTTVLTWRTCTVTVTIYVVEDGALLDRVRSNRRRCMPLSKERDVFVSLLTGFQERACSVGQIEGAISTARHRSEADGKSILVLVVVSPLSLWKT